MNKYEVYLRKNVLLVDIDTDNQPVYEKIASFSKLFENTCLDLDNFRSYCK